MSSYVYQPYIYIYVYIYIHITDLFPDVEGNGTYVYISIYI
jgi:hypothetical protein